MNNKNYLSKCSLLMILFSIALTTNMNGQTLELDWNLIDCSVNPNVEGKINGFNIGGYANGMINMQSNNVTVPNECDQCMGCDYNISGPTYASMETKPAVTTQTAKIKPGVLRFPGGTHSGWYHLYTYDDDGFYDASNPQIAKGYGMSLIEAFRLENPRSYCERDSRLLSPKNYIDGFINYVKNVQDTIGDAHQIEVTYVANLLTHFNFSAGGYFCNLPCLFCDVTCGRTMAITPWNDFDCTVSFNLPQDSFVNNPDVYRFELYYKETQDAINRIVTDLNLSETDVIYVEMGNEYYSNGFLLEGAGYPIDVYGMSANEYAYLVEVYAERLKCFFADKVNVKVGMVTLPGTTWEQTPVNMSLHHNYPGLVGLLNNNSHVEDSRTLGEVVDAVILHHYYNGDPCFDTNDINQSFNCKKEEFKNHVETNLVSKLNKLTSNFPNQRIWLTEWNMLGGPNQRNNDFINTILHASFVQEYALSLLEYNSTHSDAIEMATHHRIGEHNVWSVIQTRDGDNQEANFRSGAHAMQQISKLYEKDDLAYVGNILLDGGQTFNTTEAKTTAFVQHGNGIANEKVLIYYSNKTNEDITFTIPDQIDDLSVIQANISYLAGDYLFTYGPSNETVGRNRFNGHYNEELNELGYGEIHDQFIVVSDSMVPYDQENKFLRNSVGVLEVLLEIKVSTDEPILSEANIRIFPNPSHSLLNIELNNSINKAFQLKLTNVEGKVVVNKAVELGSNRVSLDVSAYPKGIYFVSMISEKEMICKKIMIQ